MPPSSFPLQPTTIPPSSITTQTHHKPYPPPKKKEYKNNEYIAAGMGLWVAGAKSLVKKTVAWPWSSRVGYGIAVRFSLQQIWDGNWVESSMNLEYLTRSIGRERGRLLGVGRCWDGGPSSQLSL
ncbi:hypothetical protein Pyn_23133 [Prunus yedoensis var. nudiflora]|uniref:Uncharacterized protein n=1 Tax=Prunus yedoensis var. nudiflora TaxID=2094558 RepID=A0A314YZQ4_PRUYE|nr:hypothetical protein Pyn_23133 [Prunus yedoensis var. nudiflora]